MKTWMKIGLAATAGIFLAFIAYILSVGTSQPSEPLDVGIVMGARLEADGQPSEALYYRLDKAYELFQSGLVRELWMTGGRGASGDHEAVVMKRFLVSQGLPAEAIQVDTLGISTYASARNLSTKIPAEASLLLISHTFHLRRTQFAFKQFGRNINQMVGVSGEFTALGGEIYSVLRECLALPYYWIREYE